MLRRSTFGLLASGGVLFLAGAIGLTPTWSLVTGALLLTAASLVLAVSLEDGNHESVGIRPSSPDGGSRSVELPSLERAA